MTKEEKQILLKDLCGRLPYGFTIHRYSDNRDIIFEQNELDEFAHFLEYSEGKEFKPYLRPQPSMTEEEREEFRTLILPEASCAYEDCLEWDAQIIGGGCLQISVEDFSKVVDWLIAHHFDYRGLIPMGLALEAPEEMYKTE